MRGIGSLGEEVFRHCNNLAILQVEGEINIDKEHEIGFILSFKLVVCVDILL